MSAQTTDAGPDEVIKVLISLHENFDLLDFAGPVEVITTSRHNMKDATTEAFDLTIVGGKDKVTSRQGVPIESQILFKEAYERLEEFDVLIVPGGGADAVVKEEAEPIGLIKAFVELQKNNPKRERTLMSVCTGSLLLAKAGALQGLAATTHPDYDIQLEKLCQEASAYNSDDRTEVMYARYVVNNARFDIDVGVDSDNEEEIAPANPFVQTREQFLQSRKERRKSTARKGSFSFKQSILVEENVKAREKKRLGGLRVITAGGVTSGIDASLYLSSAYVSIETAEEVARIMQYDWQKGVVVDAIDF